MIAFKQVDVFTGRAYFGNPVAVVLDAAGLNEIAMQRIANWTNLSETAFVLPPQLAAASYRVRIFTPRQELPFAGHPSVGTAHALIEAGLIDSASGELVQECAAGLLPVRVQGEGAERQIFVRAPSAKLENIADRAAAILSTALGAAAMIDPAPRVVDNGPRWWVVDLGDAATVRGLTPDLAAIAHLTTVTDTVGVAVFGREPEASQAAIAVRCFCPADGIPEDPVTGSANACIAAFLAAADRLPGLEYVASQGRELGRDGYVSLRIDGDEVWLGGHCVTVINGHIRR